MIIIVVIGVEWCGIPQSALFGCAGKVNTGGQWPLRIEHQI